MPCGGRSCWRNLLQSQQSTNWDSERERNALKVCCFSYSQHYAGLLIQDTIFQAQLMTWFTILSPCRKQRSTSEHVSPVHGAPITTRARLRGFPPFQMSLPLPCSANVPSPPSSEIATPIKEASCQIASASPCVILGISVLPVKPANVTLLQE